MPTKTIAKCTPSLGAVSLWWARCTEAILWPISTGKSIFYLRDGQGGEIAEVRNGIVDGVLEFSKQNEVSYLLWIDDDVLVFPGCLLQLKSHDRDIAAGVYFTKRPGRLSEPLIFPDPRGGTDTFVPNRAYEVWGHGMGLTLVKTDVYRRMRDELNLPLDKYGRPSWYHTSQVETEVMQDEFGTIHVGFTEDLWFLNHAAKLGIKPLIDTSCHAFGFHYDRETDKGYPQEQWEQWVAGKPITWQTASGEVVWD